MYMSSSDAEIMCNSKADMRAIYEEWVKVNNTDLSLLKPYRFKQTQICVVNLKWEEATLKS